MDEKLLGLLNRQILKFEIGNRKQCKFKFVLLKWIEDVDREFSESKLVLTLTWPSKDTV